jgi:hypothetical protein
MNNVELGPSTCWEYFMKEFGLFQGLYPITRSMPTFLNTFYVSLNTKKENHLIYIISLIWSLILDLGT